MSGTARMCGWLVTSAALLGVGCRTGEPRDAGGRAAGEPPAECVLAADAAPSATAATAPAIREPDHATADDADAAGPSPLTPLDNFYPIVDGRAYRGAQVRGETLAYLARRYGIKTVVNLRGANPGAQWYESEKADCARLGLRMIDVRLSASELPAPESLLALLDAFEPENEPLLMHCRGGADRSGMAAALWRRVALGEDAESAGGQLSFLFGHFRNVHPEMFDMVKMFVPSRAWAETQYPRLREAYQRDRGPRARGGNDD